MKSHNDRCSLLFRLLRTRDFDDLCSSVAVEADRVRRWATDIGS
jgi:hypothetical protein